MSLVHNVRSPCLSTDIKVLIGIISTLMIILSAFRLEVMDDDFDNDTQDTSPTNIITIDQKSLDALSKFDRNVRLFFVVVEVAQKDILECD